MKTMTTAVTDSGQEVEVSVQGPVVSVYLNGICLAYGMPSIEEALEAADKTITQHKLRSK